MTEDSYMRVIVTNETATLCRALEHIKKGQMERAIVLLERELDGCVMSLDHMRKKAQPADQKILTSALRAARTYRRRNPHHTEADMSGTALADVQETARRVLEELED
jgi:hypothetical protein